MKRGLAFLIIAGSVLGVAVLSLTFIGLSPIYANHIVDNNCTEKIVEYLQATGLEDAEINSFIDKYCT